LKVDKKTNESVNWNIFSNFQKSM